MKSVVLVGRPNVGKSSIFNVLTKSRNALVADIPGLTRDRHYSKITINDFEFLIVDTGGIQKNNGEDISSYISKQTELAIDESEIIFFIVDGRLGRHPQDEEIAKLIRKKNKIILLVINKSEGLNSDELFFEFKNLGFKNQICISAAHNQGISFLEDFLTPYGNKSDKKIDENRIKIAILGKPNAGKSTLINSVIGEERFIAFDEPGTTRDSISTDFEYNGIKFTLTDTAGIRKKGNVVNVIEKFSLLKSILAIHNSDLSILLISANEGLSSQDLQIYGYIVNSGKPLVVAVNKWDLLDSYSKEIFKNSLSTKIHFFNNYEIFYISALKKTGIENLWGAIFRAYNSSRFKIKTPALNKFISDLQLTHQPPFSRGIRPKLKYAHQGDICPPTIVIHGNHLQSLKKDYIKFIESSLIKTFNLIGTPVKIIFNEADNPYDSIKIKPKKIGLVTKRKEINKKREELRKKKLS